jgi:hypothetical protein
MAGLRTRVPSFPHPERRGTRGHCLIACCHATSGIPLFSTATVQFPRLAGKLHRDALFLVDNLIASSRSSFLCHLLDLSGQIKRRRGADTHYLPCGSRVRVSTPCWICVPSNWIARDSALYAISNNAYNKDMGLSIYIGSFCRPRRHTVLSWSIERKISLSFSLLNGRARTF